jgi:hypothetical protein
MMWCILVALTLFHPVLELCGLGNHWSSGPLWRGAAVAVVAVLLWALWPGWERTRQGWAVRWIQRDFEQLSRFFKLQGEHAFVCSWYSLYVANVARGLLDVGIAPGRLEHRG